MMDELDDERVLSVAFKLKLPAVQSLVVNGYSHWHLTENLTVPVNVSCLPFIVLWTLNGKS